MRDLIYTSMKHLKEYNAFILEYSKGSRTEAIDMDEMVRLYNEKCSDWDLESDTQIYRGSYTSHNMFYVNPSKHEWRYSANASGVYQALLPHLKSWKDAPPRNQSLIMATDYSTATSFGDGNVFLMIPFNDVEIGMCPCYDLWCSNKFMKEITGDEYVSWEDIDYELLDFLEQNAPEKYVEVYDSHPGKDYSRKSKRFKPNMIKNHIIDIINDIDKLPLEELKTEWSYNSDDHDPYRIINIWIGDYNHMTLLEFLEMFFDFKKNGFKIVDKQSELENGKEVWSSGEFLGIHVNNESEFKDRVKLSRTSNQNNNQS